MAMFSMKKGGGLRRDKHARGLKSRIAWGFQVGAKGGMFTKSRRGKRGVKLFF